MTKPEPQPLKNSPTTCPEGLPWPRNSCTLLDRNYKTCEHNNTAQGKVKWWCGWIPNKN